LKKNDGFHCPSRDLLNEFLGSAGAGGNWPTIGEYQDPSVVVQEQPLFCGCACALMVLRALQVPDLPSQAALFELAGLRPFSVEYLADAMNDKDNSGQVRLWRGGAIELPGADDHQALDVLCQTGPWIAHLREEMERLGHFVVVERKVNHELHILDPAPDGTAYRMAIDTFLEHWNTQAVFAVRL
jgi:ABC-type bacteriocin/lantibiotic exporter with double-glycine peptidase domain